MLRPDRGIAAAQAFFRRALASHPDRAPRKVTLDGHVPSHRALRLLRREHPAWRRVRVRSSKYLNNIIEQDHRAIKRRCASMKGFKSFANAAVTIAGVELAHRIHKIARRVSCANAARAMTAVCVFTARYQPHGAAICRGSGRLGFSPLERSWHSARLWSAIIRAADTSLSRESACRAFAPICFAIVSQDTRLGSRNLRGLP